MCAQGYSSKCHRFLTHLCICTWYKLVYHFPVVKSVGVVLLSYCETDKEIKECTCVRVTDPPKKNTGPFLIHDSITQKLLRPVICHRPDKCCAKRRFALVPSWNKHLQFLRSESYHNISESTWFFQSIWFRDSHFGFDRLVSIAGPDPIFTWTNLW